MIGIISFVQIKSLGAKAGVVLNPGTSLSQIEYVLDCKQLRSQPCHSIRVASDQFTDSIVQTHYFSGSDKLGRE